MTPGQGALVTRVSRLEERVDEHDDRFDDVNRRFAWFGGVVVVAAVGFAFTVLTLVPPG